MTTVTVNDFSFLFVVATGSKRADKSFILVKPDNATPLPLNDFLF